MGCNGNPPVRERSEYIASPPPPPPLYEVAEPEDEPKEDENSFAVGVIVGGLLF